VGLAIVGIVGGLLAAIVTGATLFGHDKTQTVIVASPPAAVPGRTERIAKCIRRHGLRAPRVSVGITGVGVAYPRNEAMFKRCDWPSLTPSSTDGYTEVRVRNTDLPKPAAAAYNTVAAFQAQCDELDVTFVLNHMALRQFTSGRLLLDRIYEVDGQAGAALKIRQLDRVPADVSRLIPLPTASAQAFYVLYSGHFALFDAHCAAGRRPM
jgi:hypothetical protein